MQLQLHFFWSSAEAHDDTLWRETFSVQPMQQSLQTKEPAHKTFQNTHNLDQILKKIILKTEQPILAPAVCYSYNDANKSIGATNLCKLIPVIHQK